MKRYLQSSVIIILILGLSLFAGCAGDAAQDKAAEEKDTLYQVSTINSLLAGNYDGFRSVGDLKENGDFGIGTFDTLDGEMVVIDGKVYKVKDTGEVLEMEDSVKTPFAAVTFFEKDKAQELSSISDLDSLCQELDSLIENKEMFYAFRIDGIFEYVKTRSVPKQSKPYPILSEITKNQPTFEYEGIPGSLVGFWCPEFIGSVNVPGYHLHFISEDRTKGGHLLDLRLNGATVYADITDSFKMELSEFGTSASITDVQEEIEKVEQ